MSIQTRLPLEPENRAPDTPQIYVASSLTHLDRAGIRLVKDECDIINNAIVEMSAEASDRWEVRVHVPAVWSAPSPTDTRGAEEIYRFNSGLVFCDCDALIIHGHQGGSMGAGQEFGWAEQLGLPILYLYYKGEPVSRQLAGTPAFLETCQFESPIELREAVRNFIRHWRSVIQDGPRRRRSLALRYEAVRIGLKVAWDSQPAKHKETSALSRLPDRRIEELLERPERLAFAPLEQLVGLASALGLELGRLLLPIALPELRADQLRVLFAAEAEHGWTAHDTEQVAEFARLQLARGGTMRFPLNTIDDWARLYEAWNRGPDR